MIFLKIGNAKNSLKNYRSSLIRRSTPCKFIEILPATHFKKPEKSNLL